MKLYELQRTYDEEIVLARGNAQKLLVINATYSDARNKIEQSYLAQTSITYNAVSKLSNAFANIKVGSADKSKILDLNKTKSDLNKERQEIENSYAVGTTDYASYQKSLSDIQNKESENRIAIEQAEAERRKAIWSGFTTAISGYFGSMKDEYTQKTDESIQKVLSGTGDTDKAVKEMYANMAISAGATFGQLITDGEGFSKAFLKTALATLKSLVPIISAQILGYSLATPDSVATLGVSGLLKHAALTAILYGAVGLAESAVSGAFKDGVVNFKGKGTGTSDSNLVRISHGESVMTAKATANPINQKFFEHANNGGDFFSFLQSDKDIQKQLAQQRLMESYESVSKQREMFDRIVEGNRNTIQQLRDSNRELKQSQITMISKLDEINKTLQTKKIIHSEHAYKIDVQNNVVGALQSTDIFRS